MHSSGKQSVSILSCLFWPKPPATVLAKHHENIPKKVEIPRFPYMDLPGRYFGSGIIPQNGGEKHAKNVARFGGIWNGGKLQKIPPYPHPRSGSFGFYNKFQRWSFAGTERKIESNTERVGEIGNTSNDVHEKNVSHFGVSESIFDGNALPKGIYRPVGAICETTKIPRLGQKIKNSPGLAKSSKRTELSYGKMERKKFPRESNNKRFTLRFLPTCMGRNRHQVKRNCAGVLERKINPPYKCEELEAAMNTVMSLAKPKEKVSLSVDNSVTFAYLKKGGGKIPSLNQLVRPFLKWCMEKEILLEVHLIKSAEDLADGPSRWQQDKGDYTLNKNLFQHILFTMKDFINPKVDMFASPGNHQLPKFVARYPHWQAMEVNALKCPLDKIENCYANPPWKVISPWLHRLRENKHLRCLMIVPYWVSSPWWPLLLKMQVKGTPALIIPPFPGMFSNCWGEYMPAPHWPLACLILSGKAWQIRKFKVKWQTLT
jgi:hypothetical protein